MSPTVRVTFGMLMLTLSLVFAADWLGFIPHQKELEVESRKQLAELLAVQLTSLTQSGDSRHIRTTLNALVERDPDVASAALRVLADDSLIEVGDHRGNWTLDEDSDVSTGDQLVVPIFQNDERWGSVEVRFSPPQSGLLPFVRRNSFFSMLAFLAAAGFSLYFWFLRRVLSHLDPSRVVPERVRAAFNSLAEGVVILDEKARVVLVNSAFADTASEGLDSLVGRNVSDLNWSSYKSEAALKEDTLPWQKVLRDGQPIKGARLTIHKESNLERSFGVNCTPIHGDGSQTRGVIVTFDDLTEVEERNERLNVTLTELKQVQADVNIKNKELQKLATRDPLTNCLNRRAFTDQFEPLFVHAREGGRELICLMADIDHFKRINDNYGHGVGDKVITFVAEVFRKHLRKEDLLGRYGGEEYCIILDGISLDEAKGVAERMRAEVTKGDPSAFTSALRVTASFGLACISDDIQSPSDLVNRADKALYIAKESGRNRVAVWGEDVADAPSWDRFASAATQASASVTRLPTAGTGTGDREEDAAERIRVLEQISRERAEQFDAYVAYDQTTSLPVRSLFIDRVEQSLLRARRHGHVLAVLSLGLSDLKRVNDTLGYDAAQELLREASQRLREALRKSDTVSLLPRSVEDTTISKLSDSEFGLLLPSVEDTEAITWIIRRVFDAFKAPLVIDLHQFPINCNVGVGVYPTDGEDAITLTKNAGVSRYYAEQKGGDNRVEFFSEQINRSSREQLYLESEMSAAIGADQFELLYQPKLDLSSGRISGFEALLRWNHPEKGVLAPGEFMDIAERTRWINPIGDWVLQRACEQIGELSRACDRPLSLSVNLSSVQFAQPSLADRIIAILDATDTPPGIVELELTESCLMENMETTFVCLSRLQAKGVSVSIDDFGTGYSGLSYLRSLPINILKIDRSFVADINTSSHDEAIVRAILSMANALELSVVAEGVETRAQLDYLVEMGCREAQGYLFSRPVAFEQAREMLRDGCDWQRAESA